MDTEKDTGAPERLGGQLERVRSIAAANMRHMPERGWWEDQPAVDHATHRENRWAQAIPNRFRWATLDQLPDAAGATVRLWADTGASCNLLLVGPVGVGKTHAAVAAAKLLHERGMEVEFWPVVELLDGLRPGSADCDTLFDRLTRDADVLVLDDLGRQKPTEWADERLYAIVNRRWMDEKPTIVTTTFTARQLTKLVGEHMLSRLAHGATVVTLDGTDRRAARS